MQDRCESSQIGKMELINFYHKTFIKIQFLTNSQNGFTLGSRRHIDDRLFNTYRLMENHNSIYHKNIPYTTKNKLLYQKLLEFHFNSFPSGEFICLIFTQIPWKQSICQMFFQICFIFVQFNSPPLNISQRICWVMLICQSKCVLQMWEGLHWVWTHYIRGTTQLFHSTSEKSGIDLTLTLHM